QLADEVEVRPPCLFGRQAHEKVGAAAEGTPFAVRGRDPVFGEREPAVVILGGRLFVAAQVALEADAREEAEHAVATAKVAAADLEEAARRELEAIDRAGHGPPRKQSPLQTAADARRRRRRFDDVDDQVTACLAGSTVGEADGHAAENAHVDETPARFLDGGGAGRLPR